MNKEEHLLFVIILFLFTLTFGKSWMEEYLGSNIENFEGSNNIPALSTMMGGNKQNREFSNPVQEEFKTRLKQKTNNDKFSTQNNKSTGLVIESFINRKPCKRSSRINMF